jgi:hypothetical protein
MSRAAGGDKIELLPAVISQRLKRKMPELSADPVGLFGRSRTLFKFLRACQRFILLNASSDSHCSRAKQFWQFFYMKTILPPCLKLLLTLPSAKLKIANVHCTSIIIGNLRCVRPIK